MACPDPSGLDIWRGLGLGLGFEGNWDGSSWGSADSQRNRAEEDALLLLMMTAL
jgi:hypothetical protein